MTVAQQQQPVPVADGDQLNGPAAGCWSDDGGVNGQTDTSAGWQCGNGYQSDSAVSESLTCRPTPAGHKRTPSDPGTSAGPTDAYANGTGADAGIDTHSNSRAPVEALQRLASGEFKRTLFKFRQRRASKDVEGSNGGGDGEADTKPASAAANGKRKKGKQAVVVLQVGSAAAATGKPAAQAALPQPAANGEATNGWFRFRSMSREAAKELAAAAAVAPAMELGATPAARDASPPRSPATPEAPAGDMPVGSPAVRPGCLGLFQKAPVAPKAAKVVGGFKAAGSDLYSPRGSGPLELAVGDTPPLQQPPAVMRDTSFESRSSEKGTGTGTSSACDDSGRGGGAGAAGPSSPLLAQELAGEGAASAAAAVGGGDGEGGIGGKKGHRRHRSLTSLLPKLPFKKAPEPEQDGKSEEGSLEGAGEGEGRATGSGAGEDKGAAGGERGGLLCFGRPAVADDSDDDRAPSVAPPAGVSGLRNLGNTCFIGAAIQCLRFTPGLALALVPGLLEPLPLPSAATASAAEAGVAPAVSTGEESDGDARTAADNAVAPADGPTALAGSPAAAAEGAGGTGVAGAEGAGGTGVAGAGTGAAAAGGVGGAVDDAAVAGSDAAAAGGGGDGDAQVGVACAGAAGLGGVDDAEQAAAATAPVISRCSCGAVEAAARARVGEGSEGSQDDEAAGGLEGAGEAGVAAEPEAGPAAAPPPPAPVPRGEMAARFRELLHQLFRGQPGGTADPAPLLRALASLPAGADLCDGGQHDCQEAMRLLLDSLHDDLNEGVKPATASPPASPADGSGAAQADGADPDAPAAAGAADCAPCGCDDVACSDGGARCADAALAPATEPTRGTLEVAGGEPEPEAAKAERLWAEYQSRERSLVTHLFSGQLQSSVRCHSCDGRFTMYEPFLDLSLPLAREGKGERGGSIGAWFGSKSPASIGDCLAAFAADELLQGGEAFHCSVCGHGTTATKRLRVYRFPRVLLLHIKRFKYSNSQREKLTANVSYPLKGLDLSPVASDDAGAAAAPPPLYDLFAVSHHYGNLVGGHYTATCRVARAGKGREGGGADTWWSFNDDVVTRAPASNVAANTAYVLCYVRQDWQREAEAAFAAATRARAAQPPHAAQPPPRFD